MHIDPVKLAFKKNNLFKYACFTAHVNSVLYPTNNYEFNLKCIFTKSQLNPHNIQQGQHCVGSVFNTVLGNPSGKSLDYYDLQG